MKKSNAGRPKGKFKHISPLTNKEVTAPQYYKDCRKVRLLQGRQQDLEDVNINRINIFTQISEADRKLINIWCVRRKMMQTDFIRTAIREFCSKLLREELNYKDLIKNSSKKL